MHKNAQCILCILSIEKLQIIDIINLKYLKYGDIAMKYIIIVLAAYLIGSFCASIPLSVRIWGADVREKGSGNAGATNMARVYGMKAGLATFALDAVKTIAAMLLGMYLGGEIGKAMAGAACIVGHCYPVYFSFRGGKGVSVGAALGLMTGISVFAIIMAVFFAVSLSTRKVSLGSMCAAVSLPIAAFVLNVSEPMLIMCIFAAALVVFMHRSNIRRLLSGTEGDFHAKK
jgi:acyl phosphate:glycerol-3-phosphate acyltransferase